MDKRRLAEELAERSGMTKRSAFGIVGLTFDILRENLEGGTPIIIHGFGSFFVRDFLEKMVVNPDTKEKMKIDACQKIRFKQSKSMQLK